MGPAQPAANTSSSAHSPATASVPSIMSAPSPSIEQLPANIPHLEPNSVNWAIFSMRFQEAMQATHCWGYFDGTKSCPVPKDPKIRTTQQTLRSKPERSGTMRT